MVDLAEHPADGPITGADQYAERIEMAKQAQPEARTARDEIKHLGRVEKLLEAAQKLYALIVARL